jgi:hypothetical protein
MLPPAAKGGSFEKPPPLESPVKLFIRKKQKIRMVPMGNTLMKRGTMFDRV